MKAASAHGGIGGDTLRLTLYVAGESPASCTARANLASILAELEMLLEPEVIDVFSSPEEVMQHRVFVTPALVIRRSQLLEMIVGDLSVRAPVIALLRSLK